MGYKIMVSDGLSPAGVESLRAAAEVTLQPDISAEELYQALPEFDALIVRSRTKVTARLLEAGTRLKVVGRAGVGVDNIDLAAAAARGIIVVNSPLAASIAVAEHTLALMLSMARAIPQADAGIKRGKWLKRKLMGVELHGKTLGLLGLGHIGAAVAQRASAFGMAVLAYDPYLSPKQIAKRGAQAASFDEVLAQSDFVSTHLPLTPETRGQLDAAAFAQMKPGAYLIAAARGGVVDEEALLAALEAGQVGGAALDVFATEPVGESALAQHPRVVCTPHIGAQTAEAQARAGVDIAAEVLAALEGQPLRWQVTGHA